MSIGKKMLVATMLVLGIAPAATAAERPPPSASGFAALLGVVDDGGCDCARRALEYCAGRLRRARTWSLHVFIRGSGCRSRCWLPSDASTLDTRTRVALHRDASGPHAQLPVAQGRSSLAGLTFTRPALQAPGVRSTGPGTQTCDANCGSARYPRAIRVPSPALRCGDPILLKNTAGVAERRRLVGKPPAGESRAARPVGRAA